MEGLLARLQTYSDLYNGNNSNVHSMLLDHYNFYSLFRAREGLENFEQTQLGRWKLIENARTRTRPIPQMADRNETPASETSDKTLGSMRLELSLWPIS